MAGSPVCTRDGRKARIIAFDRKHLIFPIVALVTEREGFEMINSYTLNGSWVEALPDDHDLMMAD